MMTAQRVLLVYGMASLAYGMLLGFPLSSVRMKAPEAPRHLVVAHLSALIQGVMHLSLVAVIRFTNLPAWVLTACAVALVAGSVLFVAGATANWLQRIGDHFAARSLGWKLLAMSGPLNVIAVFVLLIGAVRS